ncbi:hypothetical protein SDRG_10704 [Saprolegnia diclina VS20]|uniref:U6 snRNA-associated Sm-like protein LSm8 n=2 Tax=Saprolegnia TaxID=4769 RepID=A0A067CAL9_SAPPC|nr:hypothetical protein SDRG_10704 [Saprolegnia diclina VS20]XP_012205499.1 hypothetical protein SPRG_11298 [Saprolegnia parasitica CBS 223.65]EQC31530.1 hypothetical protein SDRG_10704 [Saprolegnia diclina VS20]KDO23867.1 hypothetical protein SPRG_11298 [Saprolegnia parasitica CBS 223.65]|eukprot:XP_008614929.1 hypothetical protein SDRG_10704 [Saprolegnia diclina VS20]
MASYLQEMVDHMVSVTTNDGRNFVGTLKGYDQCINIVLDDSFERIYSAKADVQVVDLGLYIVRGDNIALIGEVEPNIKQQTQGDNARAEPMKPVTH